MHLNSIITKNSKRLFINIIYLFDIDIYFLLYQYHLVKYDLEAVKKSQNKIKSECEVRLSFAW